MINLIGHSGCSINLLDSNIVRKISPNKSYNERLIIQMQKQMSFKHNFLLSPKILNSGYDASGKFFFDMEYIKGDTLSSIFRKESITNCDYILNQILTIHTPEKKKKNITNDVLKKINELKLTDENFLILSNCNWDVLGGYCHGDLTFENIIICKNNIYLIDFLDSFVDVPIIDESKLLQDSFCFWSFRNGYIPARKLIKVCEKFDTKQHYCMLLLHLLRIIPYSSHTTKEKVLCMINKVKNKINQF